VINSAVPQNGAKQFMVFGVGCNSLPAVKAREPFGADQVRFLGRQSQSGGEKAGARRWSLVFP
jgi:hypothetical protein